MNWKCKECGLTNTTYPNSITICRCSTRDIVVVNGVRIISINKDNYKIV